jgi:hypothetical protein
VHRPGSQRRNQECEVDGRQFLRRKASSAGPNGEFDNPGGATRGVYLNRRLWAGSPARWCDRDGVSTHCSSPGGRERHLQSNEVCHELLTNEQSALDNSDLSATDSGVFDCAGVRAGIAICAEAGFDGPFDAAASAGAPLVLFPAAPGL